MACVGEFCSRYQVGDQYAKNRGGIDYVPVLNKTEMDAAMVIFAAFMVFAVGVCIFIAPLVSAGGVQLLMAGDIQAENTFAGIRYYRIAKCRDPDRADIANDEYQQEVFAFLVDREQRGRNHRAEQYMARMEYAEHYAGVIFADVAEYEHEHDSRKGTQNCVGGVSLELCPYMFYLFDYHRNGIITRAGEKVNIKI